MISLGKAINDPCGPQDKGHSLCSGLRGPTLSVGLQGLFKETELKASGPDENDQTPVIAAPISL